MKHLFWFVITLSVLSACSTSSTGRNQITLLNDSELSKMGAGSFEEMKKEQKISQDKVLTAFVQCVADEIIINVPKSAHDGDWEVVVFESEQVNAFALPGGKIGVYTGILNVTENSDQLAAIMGHEVAHVIERHSNERLSSSKIVQAGMVTADAVMVQQGVENKNIWMAGLGLGVQYGVMMPYGRTHESEADIVGQDLMARSGFDPKASIHLWENMAKLSGDAPAEFLSTHPSHQTRINQLTAHLTKAQVLQSQSKQKPRCKKPELKK